MRWGAVRLRESSLEDETGKEDGMSRQSLEVMTITSIFRMRCCLEAMLALILVSTGLITGLRGAVGGDEIRCDKAGIFAGDSTSEHRKYAPDREIDIKHLIIDVTPDFKARTVSGKTTLKFAPIAKPFQILRLNAVDIEILSVESSAKVAGYQSQDDQLWITFASAIPVGQETTVTISHKAEPEKGLYFRIPEMGYKPEDMHIWTQGEAHEARHWFPSYDYPNEKFTSEMICHVPKSMVVLSNGKMMGETDDAAGLKAVRWLQDKPHSNYLIALAAGNFEKLEDKYKDVPLAFYTPHSQIANAKNSFKDTADIMGFFEKEIGVPYPWAKYYQVVVDDFTAGGMENTSLTILTDRTLYTDAFETARSSEGLISHEMAHQWFGDYVTCKDWSHLWLNEGFATFYAHLYDEHKNGRDSKLYGLWKDSQRIFGAPDLAKPIVYKDYNDAMDQFGDRAYEKGGWVLHMLRSQLGEDLYRHCLKTYLERHALQNVVTQDLSSIIEEMSGRSYDPFFDQWVYHGGVPELTVSTSWSEKDKLAKVSVKQTQKVTDQVMLFDIPTKVRFKLKSGAVERDLKIKEREQDFFFPLNEAPVVVDFDPDYAVLAKVSFDKPNPMLYAQLEDKDNMMGRLFALDALKAKSDGETIKRLKAALKGDGFYGIRIEASKALKEIHNDAAFDSLADSLDQSDARVRRQVVQDLGEYYRTDSLAKEKKILGSEKNPDVLSGAIEDLGKYPDEANRKLILEYLGSSSYRNVLAEAAIRAIRVSDDPTYADALRKELGSRENEYSSFGFGRGLDTLAYILRNEENKAPAREFLTGYVNHKKRWIKISAITALGTLKDPQALAIVQTFSGGRDDDPVQKAAKAAIQSLNESKKVPVELSDLRKEVQDLKKDNASVKKDLEEMKKKMEANGEGSGAAPGKSGKKKGLLHIF